MKTITLVSASGKDTVPVDVKPYDVQPVMYVPWDSSVPKSEWEERHI